MDFPLLNPVLASPEFGVVTQWAADGTLLFSSYAGSFPAGASDGSLYAAVDSHDGSKYRSSSILRVPVPSLSAMSITGARNAFGSENHGGVGGLLAITGRNLADASIDLGLDYTSPFRTS